jgi:recombination protein RecA
MIDSVLSQLSPDLRKLVEQGSSFKIERQATPSMGLNAALKGGLPYGRQVLLYGSKSSGKSTLCLQMIAMAQQSGKTCAWIDSENSFDPQWAGRLGVNTDDLLVSRAHKTNDAVAVGGALLNANIDILVIDSISALMPAVYFNKDELKDLGDTKQMGAEARDMTNAIKMLNYQNNNTLLVMISQQRKALGSLYVKNIPTGGEAVKFFSTTIIKLFSSDSEGQSVKGTVEVGGRTIEKVVGREVNWLIEANKVGPTFENGKYRLIFEGDEVGVDSDEELFTLLELRGLTKKSGSWYDVFDERVQGREAAVRLLKSDNNIKEQAINALFN